ncbi:flagellar motor protein MotB [Microbacterium sp. NRRL B-14842]|uniref:flagellar motor protein MotB n=1 Tax=Microbacterium sp. NRRL B-14842 TaxID=3162881 RepID=UPI003518833C
MSVRTRRRVQESEHSGPDERWMASYLDMVTVLMCMFIVLFAMSTVDQEKFEALSASLATGFGQEPSDDVDVTSGVVVPPELIDDEGQDFADTGLEAAEREFDELSALRERLRQVLAERGLETDVTFTIDERGLTIGLVSAETFFTTNSTDLSPAATQVLDALGSVLVSAPNEISVEGHADARGSVAPFPTNWELSAGRSTQVLRYLVEAAGLPPRTSQIRGLRRHPSGGRREHPRAARREPPRGHRHPLRRQRGGASADPCRGCCADLPLTCP